MQDSSRGSASGGISPDGSAGAGVGGGGPLPDGVLLCIFRHLDLRTRFNTAALVSSRWALLATAAPELLHTVEARLAASALPSVESFTRWLTSPAVAHHVRRLSVEVEGEEPAPTAEETAAASLELGAAIVQLGTAVDGSGLLDLRISSEVPLDIAAACEMVAPSLLRCAVDVPTGSFVHATDMSASPLRELHIAAGVLEFAPPALHASLPRGLERLALGGLVDGDAVLPQKLAGLPRLRSLSLCNCALSAEGLAACLAALPALQSLRLASNDGLPSRACLAALSSRLTALSLEPAKGSPAADVGAALEAGLPQLTALRRLALRVPHGAAEHRSMPAAVARLPSLHSFAWLIGARAGSGRMLQRQLVGPLPQLPAGGWLSQLTSLALPAGVAAASLAALAAATQLQRLALDHFCALPADPQSDLLSLAGRHPALRKLRLSLGSSGCALGTAAFVQAAAALAANPRLSIAAEAAPLLPEEEWEEELFGPQPWAACL
ncbi:hypothetical protein ABPG75_009383 [Micractinium tetrahymenae]